MELAVWLPGGIFIGVAFGLVLRWVYIATNTRDCPDCRKQVDSEASVCPYCHRRLLTSEGEFIGKDDLEFEPSEPSIEARLQALEILRAEGTITDREAARRRAALLAKH